MASEIRGSDNFDTGKAVLQVVHVDNTTVLNSTSTSFVDVFEAVITPTSTSSTILVVASLSVSHANSNSFLGTVLRNGTAIGGGAAGAGSTIANIWWNIRNTVYGAMTHTAQYLDSPASTSAQTYKVQGRNSASSTFVINGASSGTTSAYGSQTASSITLMEIAS